MADKKQRTKFNLPKGAFIWPKLTVPDTKFDADGTYSVKVRVSEDAPNVRSIIEKIDAVANEALETAKEKAKTPADRKKWEIKNLPYSYVEDENGDRTGEVEFTAKLSAVGKNAKTGETWKNEPKLFDAKGTPITGSKKTKLKIWNGSVGIVSVSLGGYAPNTNIGAGASLRLEAVQLIKLNSGGSSAEDYGFKAEDDGFSINEAEDEETTDNEEQDDVAEEASDDEDF